MSTGAHPSNFTARRFFPITPADTDLAVPVRGLLIAVGGSLVVRDETGTAYTLTVPAGFFPGVVKRVAAATTATGITGFV
ncbi:MAG: hypothetical protein ACK4RV_02240 [Caulobacter sp.]